MRLKIFRFLLGAGFACLITSSLAAQTQTPQPREMGRSPIYREDAYTQWRWVGRLRQGSDCPPVDGWEKKRLLEEVISELDRRAADRQRYSPEQRRTAMADRALVRELGLDRHCVYSRIEANKPFKKPPTLEDARMDRLALSGMATLDETVSPALAEHFLAQTGAAPSLSLRSGRPSVRLTFIDSHPDEDKVSSQPPPGSQHGYTLAHLARQLLCHGNSCAATVASRRAQHYDKVSVGLQLPPPRVAKNEAGRVGLVSDLADAILKEVVEWRLEDPKDRPKLILNLSLGWDGELFGDLDVSELSKLPPDVRAVHDALRFSADRGVLVIAAAGNRRAGPQPSTLPILPAAWELRNPSRGGPKLVYSVGGWDWQGLPLPNFRHGGRPQRSAYGDHAVTKVGNRHTAIFTGTSVSTAVVSAIAGMVWHLRPELKPDQVMELVDRSGRELEPQADFYSKALPGGQAPRLLRLSLCEAVTRACAPGGRDQTAPTSFRCNRGRARRVAGSSPRYRSRHASH